MKSRLPLKRFPRPTGLKPSSTELTGLLLINFTCHLNALLTIAGFENKKKKRSVSHLETGKGSWCMDFLPTIHVCVCDKLQGDVAHFSLATPILLKG